MDCQILLWQRVRRLVRVIVNIIDTYDRVLSLFVIYTVACCVMNKVSYKL